MRWFALAGMLLVTVTPVGAQVPDAIDDLMVEARSALDALDYASAAEIARTLLDAGAEGFPEVEVVALQLLSAALYPDEPPLQNEVEAKEYLRQLVWTGPGASIPREMSWPGLDSLLEATRTETFVVYADPPDRAGLRGLDATLDVPVQASRPARITLSARALPGGDPVRLAQLDRAVRGRLDGRMLSPDGPRFRSGRYALEVTATDIESGEQVSRAYEMSLDAPALELVDVPPPLPESALLPERTPPRKKRNVLVGIGVGVATGIVAGALRADDPAGSASFDSRAFLVGGTLSLTTILGGWFDPGQPLPENAARNVDLGTTRQEAIQAAVAENTRRRSAYLASVTIGAEIHR